MLNVQILMRWSWVNFRTIAKLSECDAKQLSKWVPTGAFRPTGRDTMVMRYFRATLSTKWIHMLFLNFAEYSAIQKMPGMKTIKLCETNLKKNKIFQIQKRSLCCWVVESEDTDKSAKNDESVVQWVRCGIAVLQCCGANCLIVHPYSTLYFPNLFVHP